MLRICLIRLTLSEFILLPSSTLRLQHFYETPHQIEFYFVPRHVPLKAGENCILSEVGGGDD